MLITTDTASGISSLELTLAGTPLTPPIARPAWEPQSGWTLRLRAIGDGSVVARGKRPARRDVASTPRGALAMGSGRALRHAFTIANLASNPEYLNAIGKQRGISPLIMLARSNNIHSQCLAFAALRRLTNEPENRRRFVQAGGLPSLASSGLSAELEIQREVAACLCNVTLEPSVRRDVARVCLPAMVHLAQCGDREAARQAMGSLANLAEDMHTHTHVAAYGGARCMVALVDHDAVDIHREASRAIANLLTSFHHQAEIIEDGLPGLIHLALSPDPECQYNAALAFRKRWAAPAVALSTTMPLCSRITPSTSWPGWRSGSFR